MKDFLKQRLKEAIDNLNWFKTYEKELTDNGFEAEFIINDGVVTIEIIGVPKHLHGSGIGTKIMNKLSEKADELGIVLQLRPAASSTHSRKKLINFYSKFGFNKVSKCKLHNCCYGKYY